MPLIRAGRIGGSGSPRWCGWRTKIASTWAREVSTPRLESISIGNRDWATPFLYYTNGAAVSEVMIDRLTGELSVARVDILLDLGRSINPAIDRGQVIGGFVQGMGWATTEELMYSEQGELLSDGANNYKVPSVDCIPADLRVEFLRRVGQSTQPSGQQSSR